MSSFQEDFTKKRGVFDDHAAVLLDDAATMRSKNVDDTTNTTNTNTNTNRDDDDEEHVVFVSRVR